MKVKIHTTEQIIAKLREVERFQSEGQSIAEACKQIAVSEHTFYKWRKRYGTMQPDEAKRVERIRARERSTQEVGC